MNTTIHAALRFNASMWASVGDCLDWPDWMLVTMFRTRGVR